MVERRKLERPLVARALHHKHELKSFAVDEVGLPKYGCSLASSAVNLSWWSYLKSLSRKSIASLEI